MNPSIPDCARWLAGRGVHVFPVDHPSLPTCAGLHARPCDGKRGKHPCCRWSQDATTNPEQVERMFAGPARNIGAACGPSGLLVIDEDEPGALDRYAVSVGVRVQATFTVATARGAHRYYRQPEGAQLGNSPGALAAFHCDVRGHGGFVVAPGSVHQAGHIYRPLDPRAPILGAPPWLLDALRPPRLAKLHRAAAHAHRPSKTLAGLLEVVVAAPEGNRNSRLFWAACRAFEHANAGLFDARNAAAALLEAAVGVGLAESEAKATITSAHRNTGTKAAR